MLVQLCVQRVAVVPVGILQSFSHCVLTVQAVPMGERQMPCLQVSPPLQLPSGQRAGVVESAMKVLVMVVRLALVSMASTVR